MNNDKWKSLTIYVAQLNRSTNPSLLIYRIQPVAVFRPASGDGVDERLLNRFSDGAARSGADRAPVDFADRRDLNRRAGQERLVGFEQLVELQGADFDLVTQVARDPHRRIARDAEQDRRVLVISQ